MSQCCQPPNELDAMSLKEMKLKLTGCFQNSDMWNLVRPAYEAKKETRQTARTWAFFIVGTVIALVGLVAALGH